MHKNASGIRLFIINNLINQGNVIHYQQDKDTHLLHNTK